MLWELMLFNVYMPFETICGTSESMYCVLQETLALPIGSMYPVQFRNCIDSKYLYHTSRTREGQNRRHLHQTAGAAEVPGAGAAPARRDLALDLG